MEMLNFVNKKLCEDCGGECCKNLPGSCSPNDFNNSLERVVDAIKSGRYTIDWWENLEENGGLNGYFVRPAIKGKEGKVKDPTWGGGHCTFLTDSGCELSDTDRPEGCRMLEPSTGADCEIHGMGKHDSAIAWINFYDLLHDFN
jgi:Fe-S-cluster containining protein